MLFYLQQVPENRIILLTTLLVEMVYCILQDINLALGPCGVAIILFVVLEYTILIIGFVCFLCPLLWKLKGRHRWKYSVPLVIQFVGALLYLYGDNIPQLVNRYGSELGCGEVCRQNNNIAGIISLGVALLIFKLGTKIWENIYNYWYRTEIERGDEPKSEESKFLLWPTEMITYVVKIDAVYSALLAMEQSSDPCSEFHLSVSISLLVICVVAWIPASFTYSLSAYEFPQKKIQYICPSICPSIFASLTLVLYMLADNDLPLGCAFKCDAPVNATDKCMTTTMDDLSCRDPINYWIRFVFMAVALISIIAAIACICFQYQRQWPEERAKQFDKEPVVTFEDLTLNPAVRLTEHQGGTHGLANIEGQLRIVAEDKAKLGTTTVNQALRFNRDGNQLGLVEHTSSDPAQYGLNDSYEIVPIGEATKGIKENWAVGMTVPRIGIVPIKSILTESPFFP